MAIDATVSPEQIHDPVSNVLKWILLAVAVATFGMMAWATVLTYDRAPPQPERLVTSSGATLMTAADLFSGKEGFQKADLMDYGSGQDLVFVFDLTDIKTIAQQVEERTPTEGNAAPDSTRCEQS
jgi:hypothetical protein